MKRSEYIKKQIELSIDNLAKIKAHPDTRLIKYPELKEAFDYVSSIYSDINIKDCEIYHSTRDVIKQFGYGGAGGFYNTFCKSIVVTDHIDTENGFSGISSEYTLDEVLVHELIHYCSNSKNPTSTISVEEEIAYGKSIGYLRLKGRSDEFIINKNMLPFLVNKVNSNKIIFSLISKKGYNKKEFLKLSDEGKSIILKEIEENLTEIIIGEAYKIGEKMILAYSENEVIKPKKINKKVFLLEEF